MRKVITFLLAALLLAGCGSPAAAPAPTADPTTDPTTAPTTAPTATPDPTATPMVEVDEGLFTVTITMPQEFVGEKTQEELDLEREELGYKSADLNDDGSVTYVMTKRQHREALKKTAEGMQETINGIVGSPDYPGISAIHVNDDLTEFRIVMNTKSVGLNETFVAMTLAFGSKLYNTFAGDPDKDGVITWIYEETGEELFALGVNEIMNG